MTRFLLSNQIYLVVYTTEYASIIFYRSIIYNLFANCSISVTTNIVSFPQNYII